MVINKLHISVGTIAGGWMRGVIAQNLGPGPYLSPGGFVGLIFTIAVLILAAILIVLAVLKRLELIPERFIHRRDSRQRPGAEPKCGQCGYFVTALTTMICPECGSDLRAVGIVAPMTSRGVKEMAAPGQSASPTRTVTVLLTDIKDFTLRTQDSSRDSTLTLLRRHRDIVQPIVQRRSGRVIKSTGDGLIASFDSATDALLAAMEVQGAVELNNQQAFTEQDKFQLRIAVSTGEVAFVPDDLFGQPVNLASRVQQLAQPGDVLFTDATFHAMNRREIDCQSLGSVEVKGMAEKISLYRCVRPNSRP